MWPSMTFVYKQALYGHFTPAFWLHNNLCESTALEHKFQSWFCTQTFVLKISGIQKYIRLRF
jgi:hypothetical protein